MLVIATMYSGGKEKAITFFHFRLLVQFEAEICLKPKVTVSFPVKPHKPQALYPSDVNIQTWYNTLGRTPMLRCSTQAPQGWHQLLLFVSGVSSSLSCKRNSCGLWNTSSTVMQGFNFLMNDLLFIVELTLTGLLDLCLLQRMKLFHFFSLWNSFYFYLEYLISFPLSMVKCTVD